MRSSVTTAWCLAMTAATLFLLPLPLPAKARRTGTPAARSSATYTVKKGDTLFSLSKKFNVGIDELTAANGIDRGSLRAGMKLRIPGGGATVPAAARPARPDKRSRITEDAAVAAGSRPSFSWPAARILRYQRDGEDGVKPLGIVIVTRPGSEVRSSAAGVVKKIGYMRGYGNYVVLNHEGRYNTVYANLGKITVAEGDRVGERRVIGRIDRSTDRIHFQIGHAGRPENPLKYLPHNI